MNDKDISAPLEEPACCPSSLPPGENGAFAPEPPPDLPFGIGEVSADVAAAPDVESAQTEEVGAGGPFPEAAAPSAETAQPVPEWFKNFGGVMKEHLANLRGLIKWTKTKDENAYKISAELEKYRADYGATAFRAVGLSIISFREDCRKTLGDCEKYRFDEENVRKRLSFLCDDYFDMLSNSGIEESNCVWLFNGMPVKQTKAEERSAPLQAFPELTVSQSFDEGQPPAIETADDLLDYLVSVENEVKRLVANNEALDKCLAAYIEYSKIVERDLIRLNLMPSVRALLTVGDKLREMTEESLSALSEDNCREKLTRCLDYVICSLEDVLLIGGITIDSEPVEYFDPKKNRVIRTVETNDQSLDRRIAASYTECYILKGKVIYPSKVDVYKYVQKNENNTDNNEGE